ncbi:hypothetical protein [Streptococcus suis]
MYTIYFYKDKNGREPVLEYLRELEKAQRELADLKERGINNGK